jgi:hypothetical protein
MSPHIRIGPESVLTAHAPSPPAAGSHCPAREEKIQLPIAEQNLTGSVFGQYQPQVPGAEFGLGVR